jgi:TM2 domain-containing membrane protein YozV
MNAHFWHYVQSGWSEDQVIGPIAEPDFARLLRDGTVTAKSKVMSETRTKSKWLEVRQIPTCLEIVEKGRNERESQKKNEAEAKRQTRELALQEKAERKQQEELIRVEEQRQLRQQEQARADHEELQARRHQQLMTERHQALMLSQPQQSAPQMIVQTNVIVHQQRSSNRGLAVLLNIFLFPGVGQLVQGKTALGIVLMISWVVSIALIFVFCIGLLLAPIVWLIAVIDAAAND